MLGGASSTSTDMVGREAYGALQKWSSEYKPKNILIRFILGTLKTGPWFCESAKLGSRIWILASVVEVDRVDHGLGLRSRTEALRCHFFGAKSHFFPSPAQVTFSAFLAWTVEGGLEGGGGSACFRSKNICNLNCLNISNPQLDTLVRKFDQP